jgi:hypothetical protein
MNDLDVYTIGAEQVSYSVCSVGFSHMPLDRRSFGGTQLPTGLRKKIICQPRSYVSVLHEFCIANPFSL